MAINQGVVKIENIIFSKMHELILVVLYILNTFHLSEFFEKGGDPVGNGHELGIS
jgi:hypothetical protein